MGIRRGRRGRLPQAAGLAVLAIALASCATGTGRNSAAATPSAATPSAATPSAATPSAATRSTAARSTAARSTATRVRTFAPYDANGHLTAHPASTASGSCFTASVAAPSAHAYRCFSGNKILDPCVSPPSTGGTASVEVVCQDDPWSAATLLHLTSRLPAAAPIGEQGRPWALVLDNGARCVASGGTVPSVAGTALPYGCSDGTAAVIVDAHARRVTVAYGSTSGTTLQRRSVRTMWRS